jgi:hypothetical protein
MPTSPIQRPWYKVRWQFVLIALVVTIGSAYLHNLSKKPLEISITTGPTGQNRTLKERMLFLVSIEKAFQKKGWLATFDLEGEEGKTIKVFWESLNKPMARQIIKSQDIIPDMREMGFKRLLLNNGKQEWDVDLKN